jgi:hypothetical protein
MGRKKRDTKKIEIVEYLKKVESNGKADFAQYY